MQSWGSEEVIRPYSKSGAKLDIKKVDTSNFHSLELVEGRDYKVSYTNNKAGRNYLSFDRKGKSNAPTVTVTFIGNFKGALIKTFTIER